MVEVVVEQMTKIFNNKLKALDNVSMTIRDKTFFCLLGPSGSGKTTLMRIIAGLETPTSGRVYFDDEDVTDLTPSERNIAMVFQFPSIYPSLNVYDNIALALRREARGRGEEEARRVRWAAELLRIEEHLQKRYNQIDLGILQRVSIAKVIVRRAAVYIFDEPLSNLDVKLRESLRSELTRIHKEVGGTFIYVTHDQTEAMAIADRIGVLREGKLQQVGTPEEIFYRPANKFVAYFIGSPTINFLRSRLRIVEGGLYVAVGESFVPLGRSPDPQVLERLRATESLEIAIRPHDIAVSKTPRPHSVGCRVSAVENLGTSLILDLQSGPASFKALADAYFEVEEGDTVYAHLNPERIYVLDPKTEEIIA
jgi:multiple sugar transport system ATP-binding protein